MSPRAILLNGPVDRADTLLIDGAIRDCFVTIERVPADLQASVLISALATWVAQCMVDPATDWPLMHVAIGDAVARAIAVGRIGGNG